MTAAVAWDQLTFAAAWDQLGDDDRTLVADLLTSRRLGTPSPELPADPLRRNLIETVLDWRPADD